MAALVVPPAVSTGGLAAAVTAGNRSEGPQRAVQSAVLSLGWFPIGGPYLAAAPQVLLPDGLLNQLGLDRSAYVQLRGNNGVWSAPIVLGGRFKSNVVPVQRLEPVPFEEAFGVGIDDAMWYGTVAAGWQSLGGLFIFDPVAVRVQGVTYVFGVGHDNALWYRSPGSGWISLGGYLVRLRRRRRTARTSISAASGPMARCGRGSCLPA